MKDISEVRKEIDSIDDKLVDLFLRRLEIMKDVAESKRSRGVSVTDPAREREILARVSSEVGSEFENGARLFFSTLFAISKARQREIINGVSPLSASIERAMNECSSSFPTRAVVACAGTEGSYAQQAASLMFKIPSIVFFNDFEKVFEAVDRGLCPYGILPIENSSAGSVVSVYDLMQRYNFNIVRSIRLKVDHVLLAPSGVKLEDIKEVASHPHALAQCSGFFKSHPQIKAVPASNTAVAAKEISSGKRIDTAVIASRACAELYGLSILADGIADAAFNYTRFICLSKKLEIYPDANKFSIMLSIPHRPGALNSIISKFAAIDVNITKLESRPVPGMDFEFRFIFDFEASPTAPGVTALLSELSLDPEIDHFVFLGAYSEK
jgi:chorismate mutase/prephenate dehydratase